MVDTGHCLSQALHGSFAHRHRLCSLDTVISTTEAPGGMGQSWRGTNLLMCLRLSCNEAGEAGPDESEFLSDRRREHLPEVATDMDRLKHCPWLPRFSPRQLNQMTPFGHSLLTSTGSHQDFMIHIITMKSLH